MLQGLYAAAAGMSAQQTRMDAVSHDLANVNTTGYKGERVAFRDLLYVRDGADGVEVGSGSAATTIGRSRAQGALTPTDRALDVALAGPGWLEVRRPDGQDALTRAGALQLDARGRLTTADGSLVAGVRPLPAGASGELSIGRDGTVTTKGRDGATVALGRLTIVGVANPDGLRPLGDTQLALTAQSGPATPDPTTTVVQGHLEASTVSMADAMTDLIESQRAFAMASRAVQTQDQMMEIANGVRR